MLDGRRSPILKRDEATRYRSACMRLSYTAQDRLDLAETAKHLAQRMSEPREFDFIPLKRAARYLVGKPKAALRFRRQKHVDEITVFVDSDFAGDPVSRKSTTELVEESRRTPQFEADQRKLLVSLACVFFHSVAKKVQHCKSRGVLNIMQTRSVVAAAV